jgi:hypothetical protein
MNLKYCYMQNLKFSPIKSLYFFVISILIFNTSTISQTLVPSELLGNCVASFNVMIARRTNMDQINSMSRSRDKIYSIAINKIKIPEDELKNQISITTKLLIRELNQKDTNAAMTVSNQVWDMISFCQKEFAK